MRLPGIWGEPRERDEAIRVLRRAVELGITFIDTAHAYGVSEELIREALHPYPVEPVIDPWPASPAPAARSGDPSACARRRR
jgi:aryl-alcohol dehydrogenase-like predicted oxidoreductase